MKRTGIQKLELDGLALSRLRDGDSPPPPGPVTAWKSTLWGIRLLLRFSNWSRSVSPTRTRMNGPGTLPLNVQNVYRVGCASPSMSTPMRSSVYIFTFTIAGRFRVIGGGTFRREGQRGHPPLAQHVFAGPTVGVRPPWSSPQPCASRAAATAARK